MLESPDCTKDVPGSYGFPIIGRLVETIKFFRFGWKEYFLNKQAKYQSNIFKANLFQKTIVILDHEGMAPILNWDGKLRKDYGFGWAVPPQEHVGNIVPSVFQPEENHDKFKNLYHEILKSNSTNMVPIFFQELDKFATNWVSKSPIKLAEELERFSVSFIFNWYFGSSPNTDQVRYLYNNIFTHQLGFITKWIPNSKFRKSVPLFKGLNKFVLESPNFPRYVDMALKHGLTDQNELSKQMLFLTGMNNFLGLQSFFKSIVGELYNRPDLVAKIRTEFDEIKIKDRSDLNGLNECQLLDGTLKEILRLHPPVFFIYGRAISNFVLNSRTGNYNIYKNDHLMGVIPIAQLESSIFTDPEEFLPLRYLEEKGREISDGLIWSHGKHSENFSKTSHTCPGKNVAMFLGKVFAYEIIQNYEISLLSPASWSFGAFHLNSAAPSGDMKAFIASKSD